MIVTELTESDKGSGICAGISYDDLSGLPKFFFGGGHKKMRALSYSRVICS